MSAAQRSYDEIIDLFARGGGAPSVLSFHPSQELSLIHISERTRRTPI